MQLMDMTAIAGLAGSPQLHFTGFVTLDGASCGLSLLGSKRHGYGALIEFAKPLMGPGVRKMKAR